MGRADDFPGRALAYYASRGETPLVWGGAGAERLGLVGRVTEAQYGAIYGPGGACDPTTGERLVSTTAAGDGAGDRGAQVGGRAGGDRPGRGHAPDHGRRARRHPGLPGRGDPVPGRPAGTAADGRRPPADWSTPTPATPPPGPVTPPRTITCWWPTWSRCSTTEGGWKAADTTLWREHLHAATIVGRAAVGPGARSSSATPSSPTTARPAGWATGGSSGSPTRSWRSTPSGRRRSARPSRPGANRATGPATSPPGTPGRPSATPRSAS